MVSYGKRATVVYVPFLLLFCLCTALLFTAIRETVVAAATPGVKYRADWIKPNVVLFAAGIEMSFTE